MELPLSFSPPNLPAFPLKATDNLFSPHVVEFLWFSWYHQILLIMDTPPLRRPSWGGQPDKRFTKSSFVSLIQLLVSVLILTSMWLGARAVTAATTNEFLPYQEGCNLRWNSRFAIALAPPQIAGDGSITQSLERSDH